MSASGTCRTIRIGFLAISQAHQYLHWLPAALRLAREPGVEVTVLGTTDAGLDYIRSYDPQRLLRLDKLWVPWSRADGLFIPPPRRQALLINYARIRRFPILVTTENTSAILRRLPGFRSRLVLIKHGAGDREGSYNPKHALFDLILTNGEKHRQALLQRGLATPERCIVTGNAKLELIRPPSPIFANGRPLALYNPHFDPKLSSWLRHGAEILAEMERIPDWNFVIAPHVKLRGGPKGTASAPNILIDPGSPRSIDMSYTQAADVYIGDVSSQVYEFIQRPRPCIFLNLDRVDWERNPAYANWHLGQVIEDIAELPAALHHARSRQPEYEEVQREMTRRSIDSSDVPASERQAKAILHFARQQDA